MLNALNCNEHVEKKGNLSYLSRSSAEAGVKRDLLLTPIYHRIPLHHLPIPVDGPSFLAAGKGDAAVPAAWFLSSSLGPPEGLFGVLEIVGDHGGKAT